MNLTPSEKKLIESLRRSQGKQRKATRRPAKRRVPPQIINSIVANVFLFVIIILLAWMLVSK